MHITFEAEATWVNERESVLFLAKLNGQHIRCFVSREALDDHLGDTNSKDYITLFNAHRGKILAVTQKLIEQGVTSPAGDLVVSTKYF